MYALFFLNVLEILTEFVKSLLPYFPDFIQPKINFGHSFNLNLIVYLAPLLIGFNQATFGENVDVLGNGRAGSVEIVGDIAGGDGICSKKDQNGPSRGVGYRLKNIAS